MHLTPHWIPLVASLGLLAGGSSASAAEEAFDLWNECAKACVLDLKDGVRSSRMSVDPAIADTNGQGVLHYSMVLEGGNDALKLAIDNALSITSDGLTIRLEGGVEPNKPVRYSYTRQARGSWSLNWLVPIGHEKPSNIKVFIHELNAGNQLSHMSPIYTIEMGDELLAKLARDATFFVRAHESNEMQPTLAISHAGGQRGHGPDPAAPGKALERMGQRQGVVPARPAGRGLQLPRPAALQPRRYLGRQDLPGARR